MSPQAFNLMPKNGPARVRQLALRSLSPGRKIVVFTTKYADPRKIKDRILELSIIKRQSNFSMVFIFRWLRRKVLLLCQRNEQLLEVVSLSLSFWLKLEKPTARRVIYVHKYKTVV